MNNRKEKRRKSVSSYFTSPQNDRRRQDYERRGRTTVVPTPLEIAVSGDRRRFPESGSE